MRSEPANADEPVDDLEENKVVQLPGVDSNPGVESKKGEKTKKPPASWRECVKRRNTAPRRFTVEFSPAELDKLDVLAWRMIDKGEINASKVSDQLLVRIVLAGLNPLHFSAPSALQEVAEIDATKKGAKGKAADSAKKTDKSKG